MKARLEGKRDTKRTLEVTLALPAFLAEVRVYREGTP